MGKKKYRRVKSVHKSVKFAGIICASFTAVQAVIWIILTLIGLLCFAVNCGGGRIARSFNAVYLSLKWSFESQTCVVKPLIFLILVCLYLILSIIWLIASMQLIYVYKEWKDVRVIRRITKVWMSVTMIVCIIDLIVFIIFLLDFLCIYDHHKKVQTRSMSLVDSDDAMDLLSDDIQKVRAIYRQRETIETLKDNLKNMNETKNRAFPFLHKKSRDKVPWPIKSKPQRKNLNFSERTVPQIEEKFNSSLQTKNEDTQQNEIGTEIAVLRGKELSTEKGEWKSEAYGGYVPTIPPAIIMIVALRGIVGWIANVIMFIYMFFKIRNLGLDYSPIRGCLYIFSRKRKSNRRRKTKRKKKHK